MPIKSDRVALKMISLKALLNSSVLRDSRMKSGGQPWGGYSKGKEATTEKALLPMTTS